MGFSEEAHLFPNSDIKWILITYTDRRNCTLVLVVSGRMFLQAFCLGVYRWLVPSLTLGSKSLVDLCKKLPSQINERTSIS